MRGKTLALLLAASLRISGQSQPDMRAIMERLDRLEQQNRELISEVRSLKERLAIPTVEPGEQLAVQERRIEELDQSKVGTDQRVPVSLTGTVLFNAFLNGRSSGGQMNPTNASLTPGPAFGGGSLRQTVLGLKFNGPEFAGGGIVTGTLYLDLFGGTGTSLNQLVRLRVATLDLNWKNTTISVGQDKPILAPREPDSLAQVGVSPLTGAGNLWLWQPQFRIERRIRLGESSGLRAQVGVFQTSEFGTGLTAEYASTLAPAQPGYEGRFEWWGERGTKRVEIAPGFHVSNTHVAGQSVPSRIFSIDWLLRPASRFDFTGQFFQGENVDVLGGLRQGVRVLNERALPVHAQGGWGQLTWRATPRIAFHAYAGEQDDRDSDLARGFISKNLIYAGNVMYRFGPNVLASFEASQVRTTYIGSGIRLNPHYDLALAYLF